MDLSIGVTWLYALHQITQTDLPSTSTSSSTMVVVPCPHERYECLEGYMGMRGTGQQLVAYHGTITSSSIWGMIVHDDVVV